MYIVASGRFDNLWTERLIKQENKEDVKEILNQSIKEYPEFFDHYNSLAKLNLENKNFKIADSLIIQGVELSIKQKSRQWQLNELIETKEKIKTANNVLK